MILKPRINKSKIEQTKRSKDRAEVFTPAWICNIQNNSIDDQRFGKNYFSLNKFFETENDSNKNMPHKFLYDIEINRWLDLIKGTSAIQGYEFPFSNPNLKDKIHSIWLMPTISSCIAMTELLENDEYFSKYEILNLSAKDVGPRKKALTYLKTKMNESRNKNKFGNHIYHC